MIFGLPPVSFLLLIVGPAAIIAIMFFVSWRIWAGRMD